MNSLSGNAEGVVCMLDRYTTDDCKQLGALMTEQVKKTVSNGKPNYLLLSGGLDSVTALYALLSAGADFKVLNFWFKYFPSSDKNAVERLQSKIGFDVDYVEIPSDWNIIKEDVYTAVENCHELYSRVREVKVETIFALTYIDKYLPDDCNVFTGANGDGILGYNRTMNIMASRLGEDNVRVIRCRKAEDEPDEFKHIFGKRHTHQSVYYGEVEEFLLRFTMHACNKPQPKAIVAHAFEEYHNKYQSYRAPRPFQKASNEKSMFNTIAHQEGFKGALQMFNAMYKELHK